MIKIKNAKKKQGIEELYYSAAFGRNQK